MKITDIRTLALQGPDHHGIGGAGRTIGVLIVRVDTDAGIYGLGEAQHFQIFGMMGVRDAIGTIRQRLIGQDPMNVRPLFTDAVHGGLAPHRPGQSSGGVPLGPIVWAMSGIEMALCDLVGKALGTPVYNLLGGQYRDRILIYLDRSAPADLDNLDAWRALALDAQARGFTDIKFDIDYTAPDHTPDMWNRNIPRPQLNKIVERLAAAREAVGWEMEIAVDGHMHYDVPTAIRLANELAHLKLKWLEDPTPIMNPDALAEVRAKSPIPIAVGEVFTAEQFRQFIDGKACDIVHPDIFWVGGVHEMRRVADYADLHYIPLAMHNNGAALSTLAAAHVAAASPNFIGLEYHFHDAPWAAEIVDRGGVPLFEAGHVRLTDAPGLGIVLNEDVCRKHLAPGEVMF